jgi:hypothetical protein
VAGSMHQSTKPAKHEQPSRCSRITTYKRQRTCLANPNPMVKGKHRAKFVPALLDASKELTRNEE